jgi:plastocyanin
MKYTIKIAVDPKEVLIENDDEVINPANLTPRKQGNFVYTPALLRVEPGDRVTWICENPFTLVFKDGTPINEVEVFSTPLRNGETTQNVYHTDTFKVNDVKGHYHYTVGVFKNGSIFLDANCPDFSVN